MTNKTWYRWHRTILYDGPRGQFWYDWGPHSILGIVMALIGAILVVNG
jgi:hypothetical protein